MDLGFVWNYRGWSRRTRGDDGGLEFREVFDETARVLEFGSTELSQRTRHLWIHL